MMKSFFLMNSQSGMDSARLDGSTMERSFFRICLPRFGAAQRRWFALILNWNESVLLVVEPA